MNWENIKNSIVNFLKTGGIALLKAVGLLVAGLIVIKLVLWLLKKIFAKTSVDKITQGFILSVLRVVLIIVLLIATVQQLGVPITGIVAVLSAAGLAVGLALQGSLSNLANGLIIISTKPFVEGDYVMIDGQEGTVKSIKILTTTIVTTDNKKIVFPNSAAVNNAVINYTGRHTRRVNFDFGVAYETDVELVKKLILDIIKSNGNVYLDPPPFVALKTMSESSIGFFAYCWCDSEDYWSIYYYVMEHVFNEFKRHNISIPYNQLEIRERKDKVVMPVLKDKLPERVEKVRTEKKTGFNLFDNLLTSKHLEEKMKLKAMTKKEKKRYLKEKKEVETKIELNEQKAVEENRLGIETKQEQNQIANAKTQKATTDKQLKKGQQKPATKVQKIAAEKIVKPAEKKQKNTKK